MNTKFCKRLNTGDFRLIKLVFSASIILLSFSSYSQITWDGGAGTTNWNDNLNWTGDATPLPGNDVVIGTAVSITNVPTISLNSLSITQNVTLQSSAGATITINNASPTPAIHISNAQTLTLGAGTAASSVNLVFQAVTGATTIGGTMINTANNTLTINNGQTLTVSGTISNNGTVTCDGLIAGTGSFVQQTNATLAIGNNITIATLTAVSTGNTVNYTRSGAQNILPVSYYNLTLSGNNTKTITGTTQVAGVLSFSGAATLAIGANALTAASVNRVNAVAVTVADGSFIVNNSLLLNAADPITFSGAGTLNVAGDLICGALTANASTILVSGNFGPDSFTPNTGTVNLNGTGPQQINGGYTFNNLTLSGGGNKILTANINIAATGTLNLVSGVLQLGNFNLVFLGTTGIASITGTPKASTMIETNGNGVLRFTNPSLANTALNGTYPIGYNGTYNPLVVSGLAGGAANRTFNVRVVTGQLFTNGVNRYWEIGQSNVTGTATLSFKYNASEATGDTIKFQPYTNISGLWALAPSPSAQGVNPVTSTTAAALPATSLWTAGAPGAFYSYQTGDWNNPSTWTTDPGGSTLINPANTIPGYLDEVTILTSRTVSLTSGITTNGLDITINGGGFLNLGAFAFTSGLKSLSGQGTLKLASNSFPAPIATNTFVLAGGGTTEYNAAIVLPPQTIYNNLTINAGGTVTLAGNLTLNGNLLIQQGAFQINDATATRRQLTINGNVTVSNGASFRVGTGNTTTTTNPIGITTTVAGPYINYYDAQSHRVVVFGDFTNNGTVRFTNQTLPVYNQFPTTGFAAVYFRGSSNNTLTCNSQTDFYNLVLDKGNDNTFVLTLYSYAFGNFRLFGANTAPGDVLMGATNANPNLKKALWIRNGTLDLKGLVVIPSLTEGATAAWPTSDYIIPSNGAMILNGPFVTVLTTADDYSEVNVAYGVSGGTGLVNGVALGGNSGIAVVGSLQVNNGYLSTRESNGITYWSHGSGARFIISGGKIDTKQFHNPEGTTIGLVSYLQSGGDVIFRGRFQNTISYTDVNSLTIPVINTVRAANGIDATAGIGTLSINSNAANGFTMSGGSITLYDVCGTAATNYAFYAGCPVSNINVTGGTVQITPTAGSGLADANYAINSLAPFGNLTINRASGAASVQLNTNPLTIVGNLNLATASSILTTNNLDVTVGGNFTIQSGAAYNAGTNTTLFNGSSAQTFTVNLATALALNNFSISKPAGVAVNMAGTQKTINVSGNLNLALGTLNDNGDAINIAKNIFNSGLHTGSGKISLNGTVAQTIDGNGVFQNLELNNAFGAIGSAPVSLRANTTVNGTLTLLQDRLFNIGGFNLKLNASATVANGGTNRYILSAGNSGDGGITKQYSASSAGFTFPIGAPTLTPPLAAAYTPATISITAAPAVWGTVTVVPVGLEHPATTTKNLNLTYYWRVKSAGFSGLAAGSVTHSYMYNPADVPNPGQIGSYVPARYDEPTFTWTSGTTASINTVTHLIGVGAGDPFMTNTNTIDGDYTAGLAADFGVPAKFWSRRSGNWNQTNTWSTTGPNGPAAARIPVAGDIVIIGNYPARNDSVFLTTSFAAANTGVQNCASLQIANGSVLDVGNNPNSNFGVLQSYTGGNGKIKISATNPGAYNPLVIPFPSGDFSDFNNNGGTTHYYTGCNCYAQFYLSPTVTSYGNVIFSPAGSDNIIFPNTDVTINGNLTNNGTTSGSWLCPSWYDGPAYPGGNMPWHNPGVYHTIEKTIHITGNFFMNGGTFFFTSDNNLPQHVVVDGNVTIAANAGLDPWLG